MCPGNFGWGVGRKPRRERVPVARGFGGGVAKEARKERVPVARAFVVVRKRNNTQS